MEVVAEDRKTAESEAARIISKSIAKLLESKSRIAFGLVGGASVPGVLEALRDSDTKWEKVHLFLADERLVDIESDQSNFKVIDGALLEDLLESGRIPEENIHPFIYSGDVLDDVTDYGEELRKVSDCLDLVLLSAGDDGHVAALFPGHETMRSESPYFISTHTSPKPPAGRMSASRKLMARSKVAVCLFFGSEKKGALEMFRDPKVTVEQCPAKLVLECAEPYIVTDIK